MKKKLQAIFSTLKQNKINNENESYQQCMFRSLENSNFQIIQALLLIADCKIETSIFDQLIDKYQKYSTCLITYCPQIAEIAKDFSLFTLSHKHHFSQSVLLALYFTKQANRKVRLFISDESFAGVSHLLVDQRQIDKITSVKDSLIKQGVQIQNILSWNNEDIQFSSEDIVVIDLFDLNPAQYLPFMLKNYQQIIKSSKIYLYHRNLQDFCIEELLNKLINDSTNLDVLPLQLWPPHPYSIQFLKQQKALGLQLIEFLQKDSLHPQKQDIIIFYPLSLSLIKYTIRLRQILAKYNLKDQVNIVSNRTAHQLKNKNNIYVVKSSSQLSTWNHNFSDVLYVLDYGEESYFTFDYQFHCFVQSIQSERPSQRAKRIAWVGADRIGCYFSLRQTNSVENVQYTDEVQQLSLFLIKMIDYGLSNDIDKTNSRISSCLSLLQATKIIKNANNTYQILDKRIITYARQGVMPFFSKLLLNVMDDPSLNEHQKLKNTNLLIMSIVLLKKQGDLRAIKQEIEKSHIKPYPVWRKGGYLQSCLEILTKCELIQLRKQSQSKGQSFRRQTSKMNQRMKSKVSRFEQDQSKKSFKQMQIQDLIKQYTINEQVLYAIREQIDFFRQILQVAPVKIILQKQDVSNILRYLLNVYSKGVACNESRLKCKQYFINDDLLDVDKRSLLNYSNILPKIIIILRLEANEDRKDILFANSLSEEAYLSKFGYLPRTKQINHEKSEFIIKPKIERAQIKKDKQGSKQIEFNQIPSLVLQQFAKDNGILIDYFEEENNCELYIRQEQGTIILIHSGQQTKITNEFNDLLKELKQTVSQQLKIAPYLGSVSLSLGPGGIAKSLIVAKPVSRCIVQNLPMIVSKQDLIYLFTDFKLKEIQIMQKDDQKNRQAIITFHHSKHFSKFYLTYHRSFYLGEQMRVRPYKDYSEDTEERQRSNYIEFKWYIWRSHGKALVEFTNKEGANKALVDFTEKPEFDGAKVAASLVSQCSLVLDCLRQFTDQIYIEETLKNYGEIKTVQILKTPLKQVSGNDKHLSYLIRNILKVYQEINFKLGLIEKRPHGLRVCRGYCPNIDLINKISQELNSTVGKIGQSRLYAQTWFQIPVLVPTDSMVIYQQLLQQTIALFPERPNIQSTIEYQNNKTYIILRSCIKEVADLVHEKLSQLLQGHPIQLPDQAKHVVRNDVGLANLLDLEEKYHCRMIINAQTQGLNVLIPTKNLNKIKEEIKLKISDHFFYSIPINKKVYKIYLAQPERLEKMKKINNLETLEIQQDSYTLLMEGSAINIQKTINIYVIDSETPKGTMEKRDLAAQVCGICYEPTQLSFTLCCNHKFCEQCLVQYLQFSLRDSNLFPLKCPQSECRNLIVASDLDFLMNDDDWKRLMVFASNQYVFEHKDLSFCLTAGCAQINEIKSVDYTWISNQYFKCELCRAEFCVDCKQTHHPGKTCAESTKDPLFSKYIKQNGVRFCVKCRAPVVRWTGCYKVHCTRCNICMCFKCSPEEMVPYASEDQCYHHLNQVHGGFF